MQVRSFEMEARKCGEWQQDLERGRLWRVILAGLQLFEPEVTLFELLFHSIFNEWFFDKEQNGFATSLDIGSEAADARFVESDSGSEAVERKWVAAFSYLTRKGEN